MTPQHRQRPNASGFTLIELLVVVGLIAVMIAVSLPAVTRFLRNYRIRGATQELASEIQAARATAIKQNVNTGVVLMATGPNTYRFLREPPLPWVLPLNYDNAFMLANPERAMPERTLPQGVAFATTAAECPASTQQPVLTPFAPTGFGLRFTRLGAYCEPRAGMPNCPELNPARPSVVMFTGGNAVICVREAMTGLSRVLVVSPTGQVVDQR